MAKGRKIAATFSDGSTMTRTTTRPLAHAWKITVRIPWTRLDVEVIDGKAVEGDTRDVEIKGFSSSYELANKAAESEASKKKGRTLVNKEIVQVTEAA